MFPNYQTLTLLAVAALAGACSSSDTVDFNQVKESAVHRLLEAHFDAETSVLRIVAEGRVGGTTGTTVRYPDPSYIRVNGEPMELCDGEEDRTHCNRLDEGLQPAPGDSPDEAQAKAAVGGLANAIRNFGRGTYYFYERKMTKPAAKYTLTWKKEDGSNDLLVLPLASPLDFAAGETVAWQGVANVDTKTQAEKVALLVSGPDAESRLSLSRLDGISKTAGDPWELGGMLSLPEESTQLLQFIRTRKGEIQGEDGSRQATFTAEYRSPQRHQLVRAAKNVTARE